MRGTKPIPRNLRIVVGAKDQRPDELRPANPIPEPPVRVPPAPEHLSAREQECFTQVARKLAGMRVMTDADVDAIAVYSRNWVTALDSWERVRKVGLVVNSPKNYPIVNPYLPIARKAEAVCLRILAEFGMTPSSRNRVSQ